MGTDKKHKNITITQNKMRIVEKRPMHVLQVTPKYCPNIGGVETVVQKISETLIAHNMKVTVYSVDLNSSVRKTQNINGVSVKRFKPFLGDPFYLPEPEFSLALRHEKADIIHVHNIHTLPPLLAALTKHGKQKLVLQPHYHRFGQSAFRHSLLELYKQGIRRTMLNRVDLALVNSTYEEKIAREDFPELKNIVLLPEGLDMKEIKSIKHVPAEPKRILYIGALKSYKNVDKILEGFAQLINRGNTDCRLVIIGDGPEHESLVDRAHNLGIDSLVEWKHALSRKQLLNEYAKASTFILLSRLESFSRVVYDALLIGVPVIVLSFGPLQDLVKAGLADGVSLSPQEIADRILNSSKKKTQKIPEHMDAFLDWTEYSKRLLDIYREMLE